MEAQPPSKNEKKNPNQNKFKKKNKANSEKKLEKKLEGIKISNGKEEVDDRKETKKNPNRSNRPKPQESASSNNERDHQSFGKKNENRLNKRGKPNGKADKNNNNEINNKNEEKKSNSSTALKNERLYSDAVNIGEIATFQGATSLEKPPFTNGSQRNQFCRVYFPSEAKASTQECGANANFGEFLVKDSSLIFREGIQLNDYSFLLDQETTEISLTKDKGMQITIPLRDLDRFIFCDSEDPYCYLLFKTFPRVSSYDAQKRKMIREEPPSTWKSKFVLRIRLEDATQLHTLQNFSKMFWFGRIQTNPPAEDKNEIHITSDSNPFWKNYLWMCIFSQCSLHRSKEEFEVGGTAYQTFFEHMMPFNEEKPELGVLFVTQVIQRSKINRFLPLKDILDINQSLLKNSTTLLSHHLWMRSAVVTPSRILYYPPRSMLGNRVSRGKDSNRMMIVRFRDEDLDTPLSLNSIVGHLKDGIACEKQKYLFLGASASQMRNESCYYYQADQKEIEKIRDWVGEIPRENSRIFLRRLGLGFTSTIPTLTFRKHQISSDLPDVKNERFNFTDGIGKISLKAAELVVKKLKIPNGYIPSAFQIRLGGNKGVVAVDPSLDGIQICLRDSMKKFNSKHRILEVVGYSYPQKDTDLNRQIVVLLSALGVNDSVFHKIQHDNMMEVSKLLTDSKIAMNSLSLTLKSFGLENHIKKSRLELDREPFWFGILLSMFKSRIGKLTTNNATILMGVIDETRTLNSDEVFILVTGEDGTKRIIEGDVIIGKNPCLHPGDLRKLKAVRCGALEHLYDVIVFPSNGERPVTDQCSGSDLDGDRYFAIFSHRSSDLDIQQHPAMDPISSESVNLNQTLEEAFRDCGDYSNLGKIANIHLALCDKNGASHQNCIRMAEQHAIEVDSPKTGTRGVVPEDILKDLRFPSFMGYSSHMSYPSNSLLGELEANKDLAFGYGSNVFAKFDFAPKELQGCEEFLEESKKIFADYQSRIQSLLLLHEIPTEADLFARSVSTLPKSVQHKSESIFDSAWKDHQVVRQEFYTLFSNLSKDGKRKERARAWYQVSSEENLVESEERIWSFPWIVGSILMEREHPREAVHNLSHNYRIGKTVVEEFESVKDSLIQTYEERKKIIEELSKIIQLPLTLYGSSAYLATDILNTSDVDVAVTHTGPNVLHEIKEKILQNPEGFEFVEHVEKATVPILILKYQNYCIDISSTSPGPQKNRAPLVACDPKSGIVVSSFYNMEMGKSFRSHGEGTERCAKIVQFFRVGMASG
eukprot:TRINITY_DN3799_c0_g1_i2.p1 TRINITY_DN3799_c0_g1~~TRINITY_DN3799_c0_g1_i2.p1  ORF type:complete len:1271 (+),score=269.09 TRINITY_DN3799_c0_g1_i2:42-3854(+)